VEFHAPEAFARTESVEGLGRASAVIGAAFRLVEDQLSEVIEVAEGSKRGAYLLKLLEKTPVDAEQFAANPNRALKDIESRINRQIFCSLDVLGDFIEDQFLDPLGLPPEASRLTRQSINTSFRGRLCSTSALKKTGSTTYT